MRREIALLAAAGGALALVAGAGAIASRRQQDAELSPLPTVENGGPRGLAAARGWLAATGRGHRVVRPGDPGPAPEEVVLLVAPPAPLGEAAAAELAGHAERGGRVVWAMGAIPQPALEARVGVTRGAPPASGPAHASSPLAPHPLFDGLRLLTRGGALRQAAPERPRGLPVAGDAVRTTAMSVPVGAGEVIVLGGPDVLENAGLDAGDHLALLSRLSTLGPLAFDERFLAAEPAPRSGPRRALAAALGQALLATAVLLLALGRRLGGVRAAAEPPESRTRLDYLASLADLYRRAGAERELAEEAWRHLRRTLDLRAGIPARLPDGEALARLGGTRPATAAALARAAAGRDAGSLLAVARASAEVERLLAREGSIQGL